MTSKFGIGVAVGVAAAVGLGGAAWLTQGIASAEAAQAAPLADSSQQACSRAQEAANSYDSTGRKEGIKQFIDDKTYKPGLGAYDKSKQASATPAK